MEARLVKWWSRLFGILSIREARLHRLETEERLKRTMTMLDGEDKWFVCHPVEKRKAANENAKQ